MNILSLSCQGLCQPRHVYELKGCVSRFNPSFVFLYETKSSVSYMHSIRLRLGFGVGVFVPSFRILLFLYNYSLIRRVTFDGKNDGK